MPLKNPTSGNSHKSPARETHNPVKVGVIGCGYWGPKLARNIHQIPGADLTMLSDLRADRLAEVKGIYPHVHTTLDYKDLLDTDLDAVIIATPVFTHYQLARDFLLAGKHVLVEKPITADTVQAAELVNLAGERELVLMVGHTFEYNAAVETVRDIIQSGELGDIFYINSIRANLGLLQPDINVMWDLAPHDLSILLFVTGQFPVNVSAKGGVYVNKFRHLHEVVYLILTFDNGMIANLQLSWLDPVKQRKLTIVGSQKMLVYDDIAEDKVVIFDKGVEVPPYSITEEEFHASYHHGDETSVQFEWVEPLRKECDHFLDCIRDGGKPRSSGEAGLKVLNIIETAQRSLLNNGVELKIEY